MRNSNEFYDVKISQDIISEKERNIITNNLMKMKMSVINRVTVNRVTVNRVTVNKVKVNIGTTINVFFSLR